MAATHPSIQSRNFQLAFDFEAKPLPEPVCSHPYANPSHPMFRAYEIAQRLMKDRKPREKSQTIAAQKIREWRKNNPEKARQNYIRDIHNHRTRVHGGGGNFDMAAFLAMCKAQDNKCLCCGEEGELTVDHVIPVTMGGSSDMSNIQAICWTCNKEKRDEIIDFRIGQKMPEKIDLGF